VGKRVYGGKGRRVKCCARLGCRISPCYGPFALGGRFYNYEPFISLILHFFFRAALNIEYCISGYGGTTVFHLWCCYSSCVCRLDGSVVTSMSNSFLQDVKFPKYEG
jgi:hypothetical protein